MHRKQQWRESVDNYAQAFEYLFDKSYGVRHGMDTASKATLKCDLFCTRSTFKVAREGPTIS